MGTIGLLEHVAARAWNAWNAPRRLALAGLILAAMLASMSAVSAADLAGHVTRIKGDAFITSAGATRRASVGAEIHVEDLVETGMSSRAELTLIDGTSVTLGDDSELLINRFVYAGDASGGGDGLLSLTKGVFRALTGKMTAASGGSFEVQTPVALLGVRGTEFWGELGANGLVVALLAGKAVYIENDAGRIEITTPLQATQVTSATEAPSAPFALTQEQLQAAVATVSW